MPLFISILMEDNSLKILGSCAALPSLKMNQSAYALDMNSKTFLIDCGENAQQALRHYCVNHSRMNHIFISHLHGDHCFGLIGLISTLDLLGRRSDITIHSHKGLEEALRPQLDFFCNYLHFKVVFETYSPFSSDVIYENDKIEVASIPLKHSIPTSGFLFREKPHRRHLKADKAKFYNIPIEQYKFILAGEDYVTPDGTVVPNNVLTLPPSPQKSFAYLSDTAYNEKTIDIIKGVDLLFHESTFLDKDKVRAKQTMHSTASDAAKIASLAEVKKLVIGHFSARYRDRNMFLEEAKAIFENTFLGNDGNEFTF